MEAEKGPLEGLLIIHPQVFEDDRGSFYESYNEAKFRNLGIDIAWRQDNHGMSVLNTIRGLHFQKGEGQAKLVRCIRGRIWDVAVDIRPGSPTLGQWFGIELSPENKRMFLISQGFAHGYAVLSDQAEVVYKCSRVYDPDLESEIRWDDPELRIVWPVAEPLLSRRDRGARSFRDYLDSLE